MSELGGQVVDKYQDDVTHVVAELMTDKVKRAAEAGKFVVNRKWLDASLMMWSKAAEGEF